MATRNQILRISDVAIRYGARHAVSHFSATVSAGEIVALIGPNGAGKSSVLKAIVGMTESVGELEFCGQSLSGIDTYERIAQGISYCPQGNRVFADLTVYENLEVAGHKLQARALHDAIERTLSSFTSLSSLRSRIAGQLSGGEQQALALARALISRPRLLLLDEPTAGLTPELTTRALEMVRDVADDGTAAIIVEQKVADVLAIADSVVCLSMGSVLYSGSARTLLGDEEQLASLFL